ncbi:MAG TPA: hypothetical protein VF958_05375 [Thermoanaerobaculia bacterium]
MSSGSCVERAPPEKWRKAIPEAAAMSFHRTLQSASPAIAARWTSVIPSTRSPGLYGASDSPRVK